MGALVPGVDVGVFLPTFCEPGGRTGGEIAAFARRAEDLGFDSLWATDHLLHGSVFYGVPWLDPLLSLSFAAAVTDRVRLGTSILVIPTRHPVTLAKDLSTLAALSGNRFILGAGTGWDPREFEALGLDKRDRGARTDESLTLLDRLLSGESVDHAGRFFDVRGVEIGPPLPGPLAIWVAGGQQLARPESPEPPAFAAAVLERIARADGWIARPTATVEQIAADAQRILERTRETGRDPATFTVAHENFLHLVDTDDPGVAREEQRRAFTSVMGTGRPFEYFDAVYLTGSSKEIVEKLKQRLRAGVRSLLLHTLEASPRQLELWAQRLFPALAAGLEPGRAGR
jgi:probable F420-dependent oxidoreductase